MTSLDVLYLTHNRREFTQVSFSALQANTNWTLVDRLHVCDDRSTDGTWEWFDKAPWLDIGNTEIELTQRAFGGPVAAMSYAAQRSSADVIAKIDNDLVVCPGWLEAMLAVMERHPGLDVLGMEAGFSPPVRSAEAARGYREARHVGGIGLIRRRVFTRAPLRQNNRFFGWTDFMRHHASCGWVEPDLPCFALDRLPFAPWRSLTAEYIAKGWQREWPAYPDDMAPYWFGWLAGQQAVA